MSRRKVREIILQIIFQHDFQRDEFKKYAFKYLNDQPLSKSDKVFSENFLDCFIKNLKIVDEKIIKNLKGWSIERLSKIDLAILRLACYEIMFEDEIPTNVSINEAVELAKKYTEVESRKFINGVLDAISHESQ